MARSVNTGLRVVDHLPDSGIISLKNISCRRQQLVSGQDRLDIDRRSDVHGVHRLAMLMMRGFRALSTSPILRLDGAKQTLAWR